jgi:hypothetical protein
MAYGRKPPFVKAKPKAAKGKAKKPKLGGKNAPSTAAGVATNRNFTSRKKKGKK